MSRQRLPNRRMNATRTIEAAGQTCTACVGFDQLGRPREVFLAGGKEGSALDALLADAAVVISIALQHGISPSALAKSVGRLPDGPVTPANLDRTTAKCPASPIGAPLDLLRDFEGCP